MMKVLKQLVVGTRWEAPARSLVARAQFRVGRPQGEWQFRFRRDDHRLARLLPTLLIPTATCVDIGAQKGVFLDRILAAAPHARLYAVEPLSHYAALLRTKYLTATVFECALGERTGEVPFFFVPTAPGFSGLHDRGRYPTGAHAEARTTTLRRLDDLLDSDEQIDFIKIDVEGAELGVLRGAERLLRRWRPALIFEHIIRMAAPFGTTSERLYDFLADLPMDVLTLDGRRLSRGEFLHVVDQAASRGYDRLVETDFVAVAR